MLWYWLSPSSTYLPKLIINTHYAYECRLEIGNDNKLYLIESKTHKSLRRLSISCDPPKTKSYVNFKNSKNSCMLSMHYENLKVLCKYLSLVYHSGGVFPTCRRKLVVKYKTKNIKTNFFKKSLNHYLSRREL